MTLTDAQVAEIAERHSEADSAPDDEEWAQKYAAAAHYGRGELLSDRAEREEKLAELTRENEELRDQRDYYAGRDKAGAEIETELRAHITTLEALVRMAREALEKIAHREEGEMSVALTLHYDMRGWARAALSAMKGSV